MYFDTDALIQWLSQPTKESLAVCILLCLSPVFSLPAFGYIFRLALFRSIVLSIWEDDIAIHAMRQRFETNGIITEPAVMAGQRCEYCEIGFPMTLECDRMRKPQLFEGVIKRCASCGRPPDRGPGETLEVLAARYTT